MFTPDETNPPKEGQYSDAEIARRYEETLKRVLTTPPQHRTAKSDKANPPKKRGRPAKIKSLGSDFQNN